MAKKVVVKRKIAKRKVEFLPNGKKQFVTPQMVVDCWNSHTKIIPATYALGTAQHETGFILNEKDTEPSGYISMGLYQISAEEAIHVNMSRANLYDLEETTIVMVALMEERWKKITLSLKDSPRNPQDMWAYMAIAHNQGLAACLKTIRKYGLDWAAYKARNPNIKGIAAYGDDCITGGKFWKPEFNVCI